MHEARILSRLDLPGAVRIADLIEDGGKLCIVTDYIEGQDLKTYIYRYGRLSEKQAAAWLLELCGTLSRLHGMRPPVIFCDLKPENIMVKNRWDTGAGGFWFGLAERICGLRRKDSQGQGHTDMRRRNFIKKEACRIPERIYTALEPWEPFCLQGCIREGSVHQRREKRGNCTALEKSAG